MDSNPSAEAETADYSQAPLPPALEEGIRIALSGQEGGEGGPLADWLARHPELAAELGRFLAAERTVQGVIAAQLTDAAGRVVGGYELREEIGRGGMGVVYRAYDPALNKEVALKRLWSGADLSTEELVQFRFEAEVAASLDHPNIIRVYALGYEGGAPYLVMPLMKGGNLAERLKSLGPDRLRPANEAATTVRDIARAVQHAHERLLLHRDLKPGNILLDADCRPYVADFGLARRLDVSMTGGVAGTAAYMSPEQALGETPLTTAVDVYALGGILFELLTGAPPFGTGVAAIVLRRAIEEPAPPVRTVRPDVPRDLEAICLKCLAKSPADRYRSAAALADDLQRFLDGRPVAARSRGWLAEVAGAVSWRREARSLITWQALIPGAFNHFAFHGTVAALVYAGAPAGWSATVLLLHLASWALFVWWYAIRRKDSLSQVERGATALMIGMILAMGSILWVSLRGSEPNIAALYPFYNVVIGVGIFAHGAIHWGRHYLIGLAWMSQNLFLPFLPDWAWPALHALVGAATQLWMGYRLWQFDRAARIEAPP